MKLKVTKDFLRQVLTDEKKILKKKEIDFIHVPSWDELSCKRLWKISKRGCGLQKSTFRTKYPNDKGPDREYFFNVLNTVYPDYLKKIMLHASK